LDTTTDIDSPEFLAKLRDGDEGAYEVLVRGVSGRMLAVARRILASEEDAKDAVQDAFTSAFRGIREFEGDSKVTTWLHRVTVNASLMKLRTKRRKPTQSLDALMPAFDSTGHAAASPAAWGESGVDDETRALVRRTIEELPDDFRTVLVLRDIEGLQTADVAATLGISEPAVKTRLHRARLALRALLDPHMREGRS